MLLSCFFLRLHICLHVSDTEFSIAKCNLESRDKSFYLKTMSFQEAARDFETKVEDVMKAITQAVLPLQKKSYECCVTCFDKNGQNLDAIGKCIQECQAPAEVFGDKLRQEMQSFQNQISGCQQSCHNKFSMAFNDTEALDKRNSIQQQMEVCASSCFSDALPQLGDVRRRMLDLVNKQLQQ